MGTVQWNGNGTSDWSTAANWTPGTVPTADDDVWVGSIYQNLSVTGPAAGLGVYKSLTLGASTTFTTAAFSEGFFIKA